MKEKCSCLHQVKKGIPSVETKSTLTKFSARDQCKTPKHDCHITSLVKPHKTKSTSALTALMGQKTAICKMEKQGKNLVFFMQIADTLPSLRPSPQGLHPGLECHGRWGRQGGHPRSYRLGMPGAIGTVVGTPWAPAGSAVGNSSWGHLQGTGIVQPGPLERLRAGCAGTHQKSHAQEASVGL